MIRYFHKEYNSENYENICVFTKGFKAHGMLYTEKATEGIITLKNTKIYSYETNCECETIAEYKHVEWLNIFAKDIIAFSFTA